MKNFISSIFDVYSLSWSSVWAVICGACAFAFGDLSGLLIALLVFMSIDFATGLISASINHELKSKKSWVGIARKGVILMIVAVGNMLDVHILGNGSTVRTMIIGFYLANEGISILENAGKIGIPLPKKLRKILEELNKD
ncbi:MAG: phage holin family protein [Oscillospiraceae bacterium]|jgi:toxin secretion/phage lysis holin